MYLKASAADFKWHTHTKWTHNYAWTVSDVYRQISILHVYKIQTSKVWDQSIGCCWCKKFLSPQHSSIHWQDWWSKVEEAGPLSCKATICHTYGTGTGVNTNNFLTSCELANIFLTRNITLVGTLRANEPEIPALFLSGKQKEVSSSIFGFIND